jgi:hypothetical protein
MAHITQIPVLKIGGTWYMKLSPAFVRANDLKRSDKIIVDLSTFKIFRQINAEALGEPVKVTEEALEPAE